MAHLAEDLVLIRLCVGLLLDHEDRMIEQKDLQLGALAVRSASFPQTALEDELSIALP